MTRTVYHVLHSDGSLHGEYETSIEAEMAAFALHPEGARVKAVQVDDQPSAGEQ